MIINVHKPKGWTSFDVVKKLKGKLGVRKIGHAGTLDPLAEGVLVILTDKDTKRQKEIMSLEKEYLAKIAFGAKTKTYDLEGELNVSHKIPSIEELHSGLVNILPAFTGKVIQTPPPFSAVKVRGKRLYKLARRGNVKDKDLPSREVTISSIYLEGIKKEIIGTGSEGADLPVALMRIICGKGTYIRSLAHDIGMDLGYGGVLVGLIRSRIGPYKIEDSLGIEDIRKK